MKIGKAGNYIKLSRFGNALGQALGDALSDAFGHVLSDALDHALGDAFGHALGHALARALPLVKPLATPRAPRGGLIYHEKHVRSVTKEIFNNFQTSLEVILDEEDPSTNARKLCTYCSNTYLMKCLHKDIRD